MDSFLIPCDTKEHRIIGVIDCSSSTRGIFNGDTSIFKKFVKILESKDSSEIYLIGWNSNTEHGFKDRKTGRVTGVKVLPFMIPLQEEKKTEKTQFELAVDMLFKDIHVDSSLTYASLGINALLGNECDTWFSRSEENHIYFLTDGQIGPDNKRYRCDEFARAVRDLIRLRPRVQLHIITVQPVRIDLTEIEQTQSAAGGDVWEILKSSGLTGSVFEFVSYTRNYPEGYTQIKRGSSVPPGFLPYSGMLFKEEDYKIFLRLVKEEIHTKKSESLLILQNLVITLSTLSNNEAPFLISSLQVPGDWSWDGYLDDLFIFDDAISNNEAYNLYNEGIVSLFKETALDEEFVRFVIEDSINLELRGQSQVIAEYRQRQKNFFEECQKMLLCNAKGSIGFTHQFMSFPIDSKIIIGPIEAISEKIKIGFNEFNIGVKIGHAVVPVIPYRSELSPTAEQCFRQMIRLILYGQYGIEPMSDRIIYLILALNYQLWNSDVSDDIKASFRNIAFIVLRKKRLMSDTTELDKLKEGYYLIPNSGSLYDFRQHIIAVGQLIGSSLKPITLWYGMCLALEDAEIIARQLITCRAEIIRENGSLELIDEIKKIEIYEIPDQLDYYCVYTAEDTSKIGGYRFAPHGDCSPKYVVSSQGLEWLSRCAPNFHFCPVCHEPIRLDSFILVEPKEEIEIFDEDFVSPFIPKVKMPLPRKEKPPPRHIWPRTETYRERALRLKEHEENFRMPIWFLRIMYPRMYA